MGLEVKRKSRDIHFKNEVLDSQILKALGYLDKIVGATLGPGGRPILLDRPTMTPIFSKDGVTVAEMVSFKNPLMYCVSESAKEACARTNLESGDGTTTAIVLANALVKEGISYLKKNPSKSPQALCRELDEVSTQVVEKLKAMATPVNTEDLKKVAMVSSNFDEGVADAVVEAISLVGEDGTIITEESGGKGMVVEKRDGFSLEKGLSSLGAIHEVFINNIPDQECNYEKPYILLYNGDLLTPSDVGVFLAGCFAKMQQEGDIRPVVVIAHKFSPQVIKLFVQNVQMNTANVCPLETYSTAQPNSKNDLLADLAAFTNATVLDPITNTFSKATKQDKALDCLGQCGKARIGRYGATLLEYPCADTITERADALKKQMDGAESDYDRELIKERVSKLLGGIATIFIGGSSDIEVRERKHRVEDTINAVKSAIEMGVVSGGGAALLNIGNELFSSGSGTYKSWFHKLLRLKSGVIPAEVIVGNACSVPFYRIMENVGYSKPDIFKTMEVVLNSESAKVYDSLKHKYVEPMEGGIIDPVKVTISAFLNAISVAKLLMITGGAIILGRDETEEREADAQARAAASQISQ